MEVILTQPVTKLGARGAIVKVADGYARNWLLPQGIALVATKGAKKQALAMQRAEARKEQAKRDAATAKRDEYQGKAVTVRAAVNEKGGLYGSVGAREICDAMRQTYGLAVDQSKLRLAASEAKGGSRGVQLSEAGVHQLELVIYNDIVAEITVTVKAEEPAADAAGDAASKAPKPKPIITDGAVEDK